jgi:hypothetical protein
VGPSARQGKRKEKRKDHGLVFVPVRVGSAQPAQPDSARLMGRLGRLDWASALRADSLARLVFGSPSTSLLSLSWLAHGSVSPPLVTIGAHASASAGSSVAAPGSGAVATCACAYVCAAGVSDGRIWGAR